MVEISANDGLQILIQSDIAPDGSPKTSSEDRNDSHGLAVLAEDIDRKIRTLTVLDVLVLSLETVLKLDVPDISAEVTNLLTFKVNGVGFLDVL